MRNLYIIGAGGFGREVAWLVKRINEVKMDWNIVGFIDDNVCLHGKKIDSYKIIGSTKYLNDQKNAWATCAIGNVALRKKLIKRLKNISFATLIDPSVKISNTVSIGDGSIICAGSIITVDARIGNHNIINLNCTIGHDTILNDFVTLYPNVNVSGKVLIGESVEIGTGSQIIQELTINSDVKIGAGATVISSIYEKGTYVGCPAEKVVKKYYAK